MSGAHSEEDLSDQNSRSNKELVSEDSNSHKEKRKVKKHGHSSRRKSRSNPSGSETGPTDETPSNLPKSSAISEDGNSSNEEDVACVESTEEHFSDDINSAISDINPPSFSTRLRRRKLERRQTKPRCSGSSAGESDARKTKSEPILITLDSDSDADNLSVSTNRPNRTARVQGELIRKLGKQSHLHGRKTSDSSSSSDNSKKKHRKKKVLMSSKRKKVLARGSHLKSSSARASKLYSGRRETRRLKIRKIRQKYECKKNENLLKRSRAFLRRHSQQSSRLENRRRMPRRCSNVSQGSYYEDQEPESRKRNGGGVFRKRDSKKRGDESDIEDDIRKIAAASKPDSDSKLKNKSPRKNSDAQESSDDKNFKKRNSESDNELGLNNDQLEIKREEDQETDHPDPDKSQEDEVAQDIKLDLARIKSGRPDSVEDTKTTKPLLKKRNPDLQARSLKKKKMKTPVNVIRRRGRPRLTGKPPDEPLKDILYYNLKPRVPFLQNSFCFDVAPKLPKCRECRIAQYRNNRTMSHSYCRFMEYRKLCYNKNGVVFNAGFSNPSDAIAEHLSLWLPQPTDKPKDLNIETSKSLVEHTGDQFCDLIEQEKEALSLHIGLQQVVTWKRIVQGVREMCDVCSTTIFNIHWVCPHCGFAVCIDCYKVRKQGVVAEYDEEQPRDRDEYNWLLCSQRQSHQQDSLVMTQIIAGKALWIMRDLLHKARSKWNIPSYCKCNPQKVTPPDKLISTGINKQIMSCIPKSFPTEKTQYFNFERSLLLQNVSYDDLDVAVSDTALRWLEESDIKPENTTKKSRLSDDNFNSYEDLKLILKDTLIQDWPESAPGYEVTTFSLDDIISSVTNCQGSNGDKSLVKHFSQRYPQPVSGRDPLPIRIYSKIESELLYSEVPHSWFCNGRLLFLHKADHPDNLSLFQEQWKRGQPILVKGVDEGLDMNLWHPDSFCRDFGEVKNDLVDCKTGAVLKNLPMRKFWEGFENLGKRLTDETGEYMLLKLKDWPPGEDFSEKLPTRYNDLMKGLPLPEYTHRDGVLNLAGRLPSSFVRPDLGPKMYNAYGSALYPTKGTTNLHLDVSDAVNVMVYVGIPSDGNAQLHVQEALKAIDEGGCDSLMRSRVRTRATKPGALWHIYNARDADKIRDMLTKVALERGEKLEAHHDPIHDQSWYIDAELRLRLYREYGVEGYAIAQCLGDAVFIPAGAPHQVRNLHSCVKVAEDFVSPENIAHCFKLTQEFRNLSDTHTNHEDKLQIKNIIYHVVRDSLSHLLSEDECIN